MLRQPAVSFQVQLVFKLASGLVVGLAGPPCIEEAPTSDVASAELLDRFMRIETVNNRSPLMITGTVS